MAIRVAVIFPLVAGIVFLGTYRSFMCTVRQGALRAVAGSMSPNGVFKSMDSGKCQRVLAVREL